MGDPSFIEGPITVTVPATSANLGPGYDTLGLALDLRDELTATAVAPAPGVTGGLDVTVEGEGAEDVPRDERHLVVRAMRLAFDELQIPQPTLSLRCRNVLPHSRGLGSSSAAIVGGLALARALVVDGERRLDDAALFTLAARLEGHPDNVAPATYGGFVVSGVSASAAASAPSGPTDFFAVPAPVAPGLSAVVFVPPEGVATETARGLLPDRVPHADAASNAARAALLVVALGGRPELLLEATRDLLHQDYRTPAMPHSAALVAELRADGVPAVISGAGPTVLAFVPPVAADESAGRDADALLARCPQGWRAHHLAIDPDGVVVR